MVTIVSGEVDSDKTTALLNKYKETKGEGFLSIKVMEASQIKCYDVLELSTDNRYRLAYHEKFMPADWSHSLIQGPYNFDVTVFTYINEKIQQCVEEEITPIYLDEIGVLELMGNGFADILNALVEYKVDCVIGVRSHLLNKVIRKFQIEEYEISNL